MTSRLTNALVVNSSFSIPCLCLRDVKPAGEWHPKESDGVSNLGDWGGRLNEEPEGGFSSGESSVGCRKENRRCEAYW